MTGICTKEKYSHPGIEIVKESSITGMSGGKDTWPLGRGQGRRGPHGASSIPPRPGQLRPDEV